MATDQVGGSPNQDSTVVSLVARRMADLVPSLVDTLMASGSRRLHRDASTLFERPLLAHVLRLTGGNQLRAARLLGLNRNTLRKRCRELNVALPRGEGRPRPGAAPPPVTATRPAALLARLLND